VLIYWLAAVVGVLLGLLIVISVANALSQRVLSFHRSVGDEAQEWLDRLGRPEGESGW
jgi:hypothetical protein